MVANVPDNAGRHPADELGPELRRAVEGVLGDAPPEDLMRRTLDGLRRRRPRAARPNRRRHLGVAAALAIAASIAVLVLVGPSRDGGGRREQIPPPQQFAADRADQLPTLWAYHRASRISPEALEELLDEHAGRILVSDSESVRIRGLLGLGQEAL